MSTNGPPLPAVVQVDNVASITGRIFRKLRYSGDDGRNLWKVAALLHLGKISEAELWDSCAAAVETGAEFPLPYFYRCLAEHLEKRGADLKAELKMVRIEPYWPDSIPDELKPSMPELPATWQDPMPMPW
jgi:hypothetical protein